MYLYPRFPPGVFYLLTHQRIKYQQNSYLKRLYIDQNQKTLDYEKIPNWIVPGINGYTYI